MQINNNQCHLANIKIIYNKKKLMKLKKKSMKNSNKKNLNRLFQADLKLLRMIFLIRKRLLQETVLAKCHFLQLNNHQKFLKLQLNNFVKVDLIFILLCIKLIHYLIIQSFKRKPLKHLQCYNKMLNLANHK